MNILTKHEPYQGTIFNVSDNELSRKSIFVSIVSYRDPYIVNTIDSLLSNAKRPENIFISVVIAEFQAESNPWVQKAIDLYETHKNNINLSIEEVSNKTTYGELKKIANSKYNKENYYLSISSRSEFDPHWDSLLIKQFIDLEKNMGSDIVITAEPRKYLFHDNVVPGFVYFTNHKSKKSMQREEYDGSRVPICGYSEFVNEDNINFDLSSEKNNTSIQDYLSEKNNVKVDEEFLHKFGFPKFSSRKFTKDEYIAISYGLSEKFIFCEAKSFMKINPAKPIIIDEHQYNFYSFINLLKNNFVTLSLRFIPVYNLYEDGSPETISEKSPYYLYSDEEYKESEAMEEIERLKSNFVYGDGEINSLLSIDWSENKFKERKTLLSNEFISSVNSFISLYNFSTYENSLHWNKKC